jgi:hypothetical protein
MVAAAMRALEREHRLNGLRLDVRAAGLREDAEAIAAGVQMADSIACAPESWVTPVEAALLLHLSARYVKTLPGIRRRMVGRRVLLAEVDVLEEASARAAAAGFRCEGEVA